MVSVNRMYNWLGILGSPPLKPLSVNIFAKQALDDVLYAQNLSFHESIGEKGSDGSENIYIGLLKIGCGSYLVMRVLLKADNEIGYTLPEGLTSDIVQIVYNISSILTVNLL